MGLGDDEQRDSCWRNEGCNLSRQLVFSTSELLTFSPSFALALIWPTTTMAVTNDVEKSLQQKVVVETNAEVKETIHVDATHR